MSDTRHAMAQALAEKAWIEDRLKEVRNRNEKGVPLSIGDIETLLMMALDQGRALQIGLPIIQDIDRLLDEKEALQQDRDAYSRRLTQLERVIGVAKEALEKASETVRGWHDIESRKSGMDKGFIEQLWDLYQQSPEMKCINAALAACTKELRQ